METPQLTNDNMSRSTRKEQKNNAFTAVLLTWKDEMISFPEQVYAAIMLSLYCRERLNGGIIMNAKQKLSDERQRGAIGLGSVESEMIQHEQSPFWHWEQDDLHVDFYSLYHEEQILKSSKNGKIGANKRKENMLNQKLANTTASSSATTINKQIIRNQSKSGGLMPPAFDRIEDKVDSCSAAADAAQYKSFAESMMAVLQGNTHMNRDCSV